MITPREPFVAVIGGPVKSNKMTRDLLSKSCLEAMVIAVNEPFKRCRQSWWLENPPIWALQYNELYPFSHP
jgi:hypothetical protein